MRALFSPLKRSDTCTLRLHSLRYVSSQNSLKQSSDSAASATVSTCPSGLKFASNGNDARVVSLGVQIAAGSAYENDENAGISHLFSKMAFRSTKERSDIRLFRDIESIGGFVHKDCDRTSIRYFITVLPNKIEEAASILAETTLAPRFAVWDIEMMKEQVRLDVENLVENGHSHVMEMLHAAAFYDDVQLGRPKYSLDNLDRFDSEDLWKFHENHVTQSNLAVMGCGIQHEEMRDLVAAYFSGLPSGKAHSPRNFSYVGGESRIKNLSFPRTYVALGFCAPKKDSAEYAAFCVLKALLESRIGLNSASSFLTQYDDVNLLGFAGQSAPEDAADLTQRFASEMKKAATTLPSDEEVQAARAIATLHQTMYMNDRSNRLQLLGSAALAQRTLSKGSFADISSEAIQNAAKAALKSRPSLASVGRLTNVPRLERVTQMLK